MDLSDDILGKSCMASSETIPEFKFDLTCWYLNVRRVMELIGDPPHRASTSPEDPLAKQRMLSILKADLLAWLKVHKLPSFAQLLLNPPVAEGMLFTHLSAFYIRGLSNWRVNKLPRQGTLPEAYSKADEIVPGGRLRVRFHPEHLCSASSWSELSGKKRLFVLGAIDQANEAQMQAIPYVLASIIVPPEEWTGFGTYLWDRNEIHADEIDSFSLIRTEPPPSRRDLELLKSVPENEIKKAFAEIIGEPTIPKDWGGEKSDLFTTYLKLKGQRVSAAVAFKGPSKFHPMTLADLGKNGDQIDRLFTEPIFLAIVQHCHKIETSVRSTMRAFATRIGDLRLCCMVDGFDTIRILRAYEKCGFSKTLIYK
jgi:hypothetical protein